jgi:hypothetical protein
MQMIESAISREVLEALIRAAKDGLAIAPDKFTSVFMYDLRDLKARAKVPIHTAELEPEAPQLQAFMQRSLRVVEALLELGFTPANALFWYGCFRMSEFEDKTPVMVLSDDNTGRVIQILTKVFDGDPGGLGELYERMRKDTMSIQEDILKDVKMLSAAKAADACGLTTEGMSEIDIARAIEKTRRAVYIMKGREPVFPACQFDDKGPKEIIAGVIKTLSPYCTNWEIVVWLWATNGWLNGDSPIDLLDSEPSLVLDAAFQHIVEEAEDRALNN